MKPVNSPKVVEDCHRALVWLIPKLDQFPRNRRFTLGEKLESAVLDIMALLTEASYSREKLPLLKQANARLAVVRHLWRLSMELGCVSKKGYVYGVNVFDAIGVQLGAWYRYAKANG